MKIRIVQLVVIVATFVVAIAKAADGTDSIILHWDFLGNVTSYGNKYYILFLPLVSTLLYVVLLQYEKNPYKTNRTSRIAVTDSNTKALTKYVKVLTTLVLLALLYVTLCSAQIIGLQPLLLIAILLLIVACHVYTHKKLRRR